MPVIVLPAVKRIVGFTFDPQSSFTTPAAPWGQFGDQPMIGRLVPQLYGRGGMILGDQTGRVME